MFTINFHQNTMTFVSSFLHINVTKKNSPQKHFFRHKVRHIWVKKKLLLFTLQMNDIYWKRRTVVVAFQRMFGILERWNNNQVTPSLSKPHELSYISNICKYTYLYWSQYATDTAFHGETMFPKHLWRNVWDFQLAFDAIETTNLNSDLSTCW